MNWFWVFCLLRHSSALQFRDFTLDEIEDQAKGLIGRFADVKTASELWGDEMKSPKCTPVIVRVTDLDTLDKYSTTRPQLVLSGELHGDERVGPTSVLFAAELLVWASQCKLQGDQGSCKRLIDLSITDAQINWLSFLAVKRDTYVIPTPNCMGYLQHQRYDQGVDPNRDFPYSRRDGKCLVSKTALVLDALFRNVTVQMLITFHGGMAAIGYEWGSVQHPRGQDKCPDHMAHSMIAHSFVSFAGSFKGQKQYSAAPINSIVYPVEGGMEDWAYAAGWDTELNRQCSGRASQAIPPPNRAVTFLIETSDKKTPLASEMGHDSGILGSDTNKYGGHVSRNTRLSLAAIDSVQPYVCFANVGISLLSSQAFSVSWYVGGGFQVKSTWLSWHVLPPDILEELSTTITNSVEISGILDRFIYSLTPPSPPVFSKEKWSPQHKGTRLHASGWLSGPARWSWKDPFDVKEGIFEASEVLLPLNISHSLKRDRRNTKSRRHSQKNQTYHDPSFITRQIAATHDHEIRLLLVAWAEVDSDWGIPGQGYPATFGTKHLRERRLSNEPFPPQSHLSHARSNPNWKILNSLGEVKIQGRRYFPSDPVVVKVRAEKSSASAHSKLRMSNVYGEIESAVHDCASWDRRRGGEVRS